jgi:hypothetical protein
MIDVNTTGWKPLGETSNSRYFEVEPDIIAAVPHVGSVDDGPSAHENQTFQNQHWYKVGHGGVVLVMADRLSSQDKAARKVYGSEPDPSVMRATALISVSLLARAITSFFLGISRPQIPVKMFGTIEDAITWAHQINRAAGGERPSVKERA